MQEGLVVACDVDASETNQKLNIIANSILYFLTSSRGMSVRFVLLGINWRMKTMCDFPTCQEEQIDPRKFTTACHM